MTRLANISYTLCIQKLSALGFVRIRQGKGSHELWIHRDTQKKTIVPHHDSKDMKIGTLRAIIRQGGITIDEFLNA